ncbi:unnamed protein product [Fraxinus pennsylvanica]|uniref:PORR domain-containing protein n=1 Tax=Fraxinus pennsylvanica TaxID=56036 RepID=A0AAD1YSN8_9LAMI|nr:unnamed protein product [Fraxinus pennsylvanica]
MGIAAVLGLSGRLQLFWCFGVQFLASSQNLKPKSFSSGSILYWSWDKLITCSSSHSEFLREAYEKGCLVEPNPVYDARRKLLYLVAIRCRGLDRGIDELKIVESDGNRVKEELLKT